MLTLRQYMHQFVRKEHTAELRRLIHESGRTREFIYALAAGAPASLETALRLYKATHGRVDPRTLAHNFDWSALDAYYRQEQALDPPAALSAPVARAGRSGVAGQAGKRDTRPAGRGAGAQGAGKAQRKTVK